MSKKNNPGFTIIEVLITGMLMVVLGAAIGGLQYYITKSQGQALQSIVTVNESNYVVQDVVRELRTVRQSETGAFPFELASSNELTFYTNTDSDQQAEKVHYFLDGSELKKTVIQPQGSPASYPESAGKTKTVANNVRNNNLPIFYYYNEDWPGDTTNNPLHTPANLVEIKLVRVYIRINQDPNTPEKDYVLESYTQMRTLKENL